MRTFRATRYGFEIDVPADWRVPPTGWLSRLVGLDRKILFLGEPDVRMHFEVGDLVPEPTLAQTEEHFRRHAIYFGLGRLETGTIEVGGKDHFWARYWIQSETFVKKYALVFDGVEYSATCLLGEEEPEGRAKEPKYDKTIRTFRRIPA